jgi:Flp pilus assembly pilin Flp
MWPGVFTIWLAAIADRALGAQSARARAGQTMIEYGVLLLCVAMLALAALAMLGPAIANALKEILDVMLTAG